MKKTYCNLEGIDNQVCVSLRCKYVLIFLVNGKYEGRTEEVVSLAMMMSKMAASNIVPPFLTHTFDEVSVWSVKLVAY